jgi:hypothetical protein
MKLNLITFSVLFVTIFISCKKEEISTAGNSGVSGNIVVPILSKVMIDNQPVYEYAFNDSNLVSQEKSKYDFNIYHYNDKGQIITTEYYGNDDVLSSDQQVSESAINSAVWVTPQNGKEGGIITYEYFDNGQLSKTIYSRPQSTSNEYSNFIYDANNRISRQTMYWEDTATGYIDYSYDSKGNLVKETLYNIPSEGATELITTTQYEFDDYQNPFKSLNLLMTPGIFTNQNNIIKETYTIHLAPAEGSDNVQVTLNTYEYNTLGYPVTKNGNVSYIYK